MPVRHAGNSVGALMEDDKAGVADPDYTGYTNWQLVLASRPRQRLEEPGNAIEFDDRTGLATLTHPKRLRPFEKRVQKLIGGSDLLKRPLDVYGTRLWRLCDGQRSVAEIITVMEAEFHEAIHPAATRVQKLLEKFVQLGLIELMPPDHEVLEALVRAEAGEGSGANSRQKLEGEG